jgi:predicted phosphoribosyltransferase
MFKDRIDAAKKLLPYLIRFRNKKDVIILAIPRGALQIGNYLAKELNLPLDVALSKKIGYPGEEEFAIGAVSLTSASYDKDFVKKGEVSQKYIDDKIKELRKALQEKYRTYHGDKKPLSLKNKVVIIIDDGIATGRTMLATVELVKKEKPKKIIIAVPVGPTEAVEMLKPHVDEVICLDIESEFFAIGEFYEDFPQVEDEEAIRLLREANRGKS